MSEKDESLAQGHPKFNDAVKKVSEEIRAMSDEEFYAELEKHEDGDITQFLLETGAINYIMQDLKEREKKMNNQAIYLLKQEIETLEHRSESNSACIGTYLDHIAIYTKENQDIENTMKELKESLAILQTEEDYKPESGDPA